MDFKLEKVDDAIFHYMHDKQNILIRLHDVYEGVVKICPSLRENKNKFNNYVELALKNFQRLKMFKFYKNEKEYLYLVHMDGSYNIRLNDDIELRDIEISEIKQIVDKYYSVCKWCIYINLFFSVAMIFILLMNN